MKKLSLLFTLFLFSEITFGQRYYSVVFDNLPEDSQLFPRNEKSEANIPINGQIELANWKYLSVVVLRNKKFYQYQRSDIQYNAKGDLGTFDLKPVIKSELAEYDFQIYASQTGKDSVLMTSRSNIVAGDVYMIYGQSNARAWEVDYKYRNEYARTYGFGSQQSGFAWGLSNSGYTGGYDGEQNIVGEWGIEFQRAIIENYGIPTCVINCATSGANIKVLSDRNANNPADYNTLYGRLLDYAQKAKVINNIKGFFYWQAETDAAQNPPLWKPGFDKLYKYLEQDFPSVKKYYTFQIPLFGAGEYNDEVGVLRDYLRQLGSFYPKVTPYAPVGAAGWNGWHFELEGYIQIGKELGKIVGYDFYNEKKKISPPNIKKAYYSTKDRSEITLAFEDGQQMIYPKDTIAPKIGGGEMTISLKDFFYLNGEWQKVASGRAEGNRIILKLKKNASATDTLIKYLPSIYPYSGGSYILYEAPWIYIGPFLKNSDGMRAFIFHNAKISPFQEFQTIKLKNVINENKNVTLQWNSIAGAKNYVLERGLAKDSLNVELVLKFTNSTLSFSDTTAISSTDYWYRIKAVNELNESPFSTIKIKTIQDINAFQIKAVANYFNNGTVTWIAPSSGIWDYFVLERKQNESDSFKLLAKIESPNLSFTDTTLLANTTYIYRIKAFNAKTQSLYSQILLATPSLLGKPDLSVTTLYFNSIKINWGEILNAKSYTLEKSINGEPFKKVKDFDAKTFEYTDNSLAEGTNYTYRIKAFGNITESLFSLMETKTPALLSKPELSSTALFYNSLKINWKVVEGANQFKLERKTGTEDYKTIGTFDNKTTEFIDKNLIENSAYSYRLKAFGDKTESLVSVLTTTTPAILSLPELTFDNLTHESVKLLWKATPKATKYLLERQAQGEPNFQKIFETDNLLEYVDSKLKDISTYSYRLKAQSNVSESGYTKIDLKTLAILSTQNEVNNPFIIYPNPAKDKLSISFTEPTTGSVSLADILGKTHFEQKIYKQKSVEINVSTLKKGFYLVLIKTNEELYSQKIIIE
jgi:hypothetical protein